MAKVFELKKDRAEQAEKARKVVELSVSESRDMSADEEAVVAGFEARIAGIDRQIAVLERVEGLAGQGAEAPGRRSAPLGSDGPALDGKHKYSLLRAYRCALGIERGGLESEVSQAIATRTGKQPQGIYIPWDLATHRAETGGAAEHRTGVVNTTVGASTIASILGTDLIQLLRNRMVMNSLGATVLNDMTGGTFSLPKQTGASTMYHVAEGSAPTGSNMTFSQVTWTPKTAGAITDLTRKFILQTNQDSEALARNDLAKQMAIGLDNAGINGTGSSNQPTGILVDTNIPVVAIGTNGGAPTWDAVVGLETLVATSNADFGRLGYLTSNKGRGKLKRTPKIGSTFPTFIWEGGQGGVGQVNDYNALASEQVPSSLTKGTLSTATALIFGNFESATYAFWSGLDILVDPYTGSSSGTVRFVALQDYDYQFRYEQSFAVCKDIDPS